MKPKIKEKKYVFKNLMRIDYYENENPDYAKILFKERFLKEGYVVRDIKVQKLLVVTGWIAKAKMSYKKRLKFQQEIDEMKEPKIIKLYET